MSIKNFPSYGYNLVNGIFLGYYKERKYVDELADYRDLVVINKGETEVILKLKKVKRELSRIYPECWIGITAPEVEVSSSEYCLWTQLKHVPFGHFWFRITKLNDDDNYEICYSLKVIRELRVEDFMGAHLETSAKSDEKNPNVSEKYSFDFDPAQIGILFYSHFQALIKEIQFHLTLKNLIKVSKFCAVIIFVVFEILFSILKFGCFIFQLLQFLVKLIEALSPIIIKFLDCLCKVISGAYALLALLITDIFIQHERRTLMKSIEGPKAICCTEQASRKMRQLAISYRERDRDASQNLD